jgi:hypothetical protein
MKKWKLPIVLFLVFLITTLIFIFFSPGDIFQRLPVVENLYSNSKINITSTRGRAKIKLNGKDYGETNQEISDLTSGFYMVELSRIADEPNFYTPHTFPIDLAEGTEAVINVEIGPDDLLHGYVIYYSEATTPKGKGLISISADTETAVYIDNAYLTNTPVSTYELDESSYIIRAEAKGYEDLEIPVVNVYEDYNLNLELFLMPVPAADFENKED